VLPAVRLLRPGAGHGRVVAGMKALSIKQPWAWLILRPDVTDPAARTRLYETREIKDVENRDWRADNPGMNFRGEVLIHTGITFDMDFDPESLPTSIFAMLPSYSEIPMGGIVGKATVIDIVKDYESPWRNDARYGLILRDAEPLPFRPCVGQLGFFEPNFDRKYVEKPPKKEKIFKRIAEPAETLSLFEDKK
jgi:hypothetical protein